MIIETAHLVLRPITRDDAAALEELDSDPAVMRYVSGGRPTPRTMIEDWVIPRAIAEMSTRRGVGMFAAMDRHRGGFLGWFSLRAPRHSSRAELELTYRLRREAWGYGIATEGSRALVQVAFDRLATDRLFAGTMAVNAPSRRVMEKSGMRLAALHQADDTAIDGYERGEVEYEILRSQWETADFPWARSARAAAHLIA
ncbi:GNAT family N-acetyltransferase [Williamsia maris]|uniref:Protein N-acetyltransferase, RimJ/RimL family n=1 Tax=Williamsia maris TaxID=72806 RepID=A0ABT1HJ33_9NOCA|nr:GNAT family N-acetyltransferase [Williamsia maris]MCP2177948.1 Protein N-acetyltransferase, RimJ/RimL family [Williamsia maris]